MVEPAAELLVAALGNCGERRAVGGRCVEADHQPWLSARTPPRPTPPVRQRPARYPPATHDHIFAFSSGLQIASASRSQLFSAFCGSQYGATGNQLHGRAEIPVPREPLRTALQR